MTTRNQFTSGTLATHSPETRQKIAATLRARTPSVESRFRARFATDSTTGCWQWTGLIGWNGYGWMSLRKGAGILAHRASYELFVGPIPDGLTIDHLCRNRECVNPAHLQVVTRSENSRRAVVDQRLKTHCVQGHPRDGLRMRDGRLFAYCKQCNRENASRYYHQRNNQ